MPEAIQYTKVQAISRRGCNRLGNIGIVLTDYS